MHDFKMSSHSWIPSHPAEYKIPNSRSCISVYVFFTFFSPLKLHFIKLSILIMLVSKKLLKLNLNVTFKTKKTSLFHKRSYNTLIGSQTHQNLKEAFAGESMVCTVFKSLEEYPLMMYSLLLIYINFCYRQTADTITSPKRLMLRDTTTSLPSFVPLLKVRFHSST